MSAVLSPLYQVTVQRVPAALTTRVAHSQVCCDEPTPSGLRERALIVCMQVFQQQPHCVLDCQDEALVSVHALGFSLSSSLGSVLPGFFKKKHLDILFRISCFYVLISRFFGKKQRCLSKRSYVSFAYEPIRQFMWSISLLQQNNKCILLP